LLLFSLIALFVRTRRVPAERFARA
jgi:hypothetical protein